jgi:hypothetical protein
MVSYIKGGMQARIFDNRILRGTFGPRGMRMGSGEGSTKRNFIVCSVHQI